MVGYGNQTHKRLKSRMTKHKENLYVATADHHHNYYLQYHQQKPQNNRNMVFGKADKYF